jgi:hypothetical protein
MRIKGKLPPPAGNYKIADAAQLRDHANRHGDPRNVFYQAMLKNNTYEAYEASIRHIEVSPTTPMRTYHKKPITGRAEFLYARRQGWIEIRRLGETAA